MRAKSSSHPLYCPLHGKTGSAKKVSESKIPVVPCRLCVGVLDCPAGIRTETGRGSSPPYGKSRAAQVTQPLVLLHGPRSSGVSPAAQITWLSRGFPT